MKVSGKMCLKIILRVRKKQGFNLSLADKFFEKPQGVKGGGGRWWGRWGVARVKTI